MPARQAQFINVGSGRNSRSIAVMHQPAEPTATQKNTAPGVFWLQGFKSEMTSLKATALAQWSATRRNPFTRFDYSGHGQSSGRFEDGTIGDWLEETLAVFETFTTGPQVVVGSSMGGWLALLLLRKLLAAASDAQRVRIKGLVLIAPAWDMTEDLMWHQASDTVRDEILRNGVYMRPSAYDDEPYPITLKLIEEGRAHLIRQTPFDPGVPIRILHGALDPDVPLSHSLELQRLMHGDVAITQVPDGEHRLSRPQDLDLLMSLIKEVSQD